MPFPMPRLLAALALFAALLPAAAAASQKPPPVRRADPTDPREYLLPSETEKTTYATRFAGYVAFVSYEIQPGSYSDPTRSTLLMRFRCPLLPYSTKNLKELRR